MGQGRDVSYSDLGNIEAWYHYILDYMGNNRMAVNRDGIIEQITHYYLHGPRSHRESIFMLSARRRGFSRGQVIGDISTNENLQKFKFEGKVLAAIEKIDNLRREDEPLGEGKDRTFGLDNYDIHARNYFAMAPMWDRVDPLAEKYYAISPYVYCGSDPVNRGDYDGNVVTLQGTKNNVNRGVRLLNQGARRNAFSYDIKTKKMTYLKSDDGNINLYEATIASMILQEREITINVDSDTPKALVGNWKSKLIDVGDMEKLDNIPGTNGSAAILHEFVEQDILQSVPEEEKASIVEEAHKTAIDAEHKAAGSTSTMGVIYVNDNNHQQGHVSFEDDKGTYIYIYFDNGNL